MTRVVTSSPSSPAPRVLQRIDRFVGRTTNWLYDHLRYVPRHAPVVLCDDLDNRAEFPLLEARRRDNYAFSHRVWRRLMGDRPHPADAWWLRRTHPAVLHSHFGYVATRDFGLHGFLDVPWLVSFYGADVYELGQSQALNDEYALMFQRMDLALALGPQMAIGLETLGCPKSKIVVHPLGVDVDSIASCDRVLEPGSPLKILFAGTFREKKGIEYLIQGAADARRRGVRLHVTLVGDALQKPGDAETKAAILRAIDRLNMNDVVTRHAYVPFDQLMEMALTSHVFVAPSVTSASGDAEGTPFVLQQMMASGIPVIATAHSDIPYIFGELRGLLIPERDADAIARRLQAYWEQPETVTHDGALMLKQIRTGFDVRVRAAALSDIYDSVCGSPSKRDARTAANVDGVPLVAADSAHEPVVGRGGPRRP